MRKLLSKKKRDEMMKFPAFWVKKSYVPSLKLKAKAPENGWLESFPFGVFRPISQGRLLLVSGKVILCNSSSSLW